MNWTGNGVRQGAGTYCSKALVLRVGSSGRKFLYSSTSFSKDRSWLCSLLRRVGRDSRMWLVSCCREQVSVRQRPGKNTIHSQPEHPELWVQVNESHKTLDKNIRTLTEAGWMAQGAAESPWADAE